VPRVVRRYKLPHPIGFLIPAEEGLDDTQTMERAGENSNWGRTFGAITERTHWTPKQILELTLGQFTAYMKYWVEEKQNTNGDSDGLLFADIGTFNEASGIKRVAKQV
jgi:hypothetical protein